MRFCSAGGAQRQLTALRARKKSKAPSGRARCGTNIPRQRAHGAGVRGGREGTPPPSANVPPPAHPVTPPPPASNAATAARHLPPPTAPSLLRPTRTCPLALPYLAGCCCRCFRATCGCDPPLAPLRIKPGGRGRGMGAQRPTTGGVVYFEGPVKHGPPRSRFLFLFGFVGCYCSFFKKSG